jgi:cytidylate kinase
MIIAIDGPAASGKGTLGRRLAQHYGLGYLDSGALYRAVARDMTEAGADPHDAAAAESAARDLDSGSLNDDRLRQHGVSETASIVAQFPRVRAVLLERQRAFAGRNGGAVLDGRDIGTVVCPEADVKFFVIASDEERARRRHLELTEGGTEIGYAAILADIRKRDARDRERKAAPLKPAADAHLLDTTNLDIEAAFKAAVELIDAAMDRAGHAS